MLLVSFCQILVTCAVVLKAPVAGGLVLEPRARRLVGAEVRPDFNTLSSERHDLRCLLPGRSGRFLERKFPSAKYVWYLNGQPIRGSVTNKLQVQMKAEEAANWPWLKRFYHCAVHLKPEFVILSANYSLRQPSLLVEKQNSRRPVIIRPGSIAFVPCPLFRSEPKPVDVFFVVNNTRRLDVDNSGRYFVSEIGLQIADVGPQDQGLYQCVVRNAQSGQSFRGHPVPVHLSTSPATTQAALLYPPAGVSLVRARFGDNVTLQCVIGSVAASRIVWVKLNDNLRKLAGVRTRLGNLILSNVSRAHHGSYVCRSGQASASYALQVQSPLFVRLRLMASRFEDGSWLSDLVCDTHGDRSPTLSWFHNGRPLLDADSITVHWSVQRRGRNPRWTATISSPPPPGVYQCVATSGDESTTDSIYVSEWPSTTRRRSATNAHWSKLIRVGPTNTTVKLNSTTFLLCQLHSPGATVSWRHNDTELKLDSRRSLVGYGSLQIRQFDYIDQGWYVCEASDGRWNVTSEAAYVDVEDLTTWSIRRPLMVDNTYDATVNNHSGEIPKVPLKLAPPQAVRLDNTSVLLRWELPAKLPDRPWLFRIQLRKMADGYDWETLDAEVPGYTNSYVVERLQPSASYRFRYAVIFRNRYQETSAKSKRVTMSPEDDGRRIERPYLAPELMTAVSKWPDAIQLKWEQPFGDDAAASPVDGYLVSYRQVYAEKPLRFQNETVVGASTREHMIDRLLPATPYEVKLAAYNSAGLSAFSNTLFASTLTLDGKPSSVDFFATDSPPPSVVGQSSRKPVSSNNDSRNSIMATTTSTFNSGATILRIAGLTMAVVVVCNVLVGLGIWLVKRLVRERASVRRLRTDRRTFADTSRSIFKETHGRHQPQNEEQHYSHPVSNAADEEERSSGTANGRETATANESSRIYSTHTPASHIRWKRSLAHAVLITSSHLFWLYGLVLCGPLRSILIYDISSMVVLSALSSLFIGVSGSLKMRGVAFLALGFLFLIFLDRDYNDPATLMLTTPNAPKARTGQFVGYSSAGLPLYVSGEDFLQRTSHSLVAFVKNTIHQILAQPDSRRIFFFLCVNLLLSGFVNGLFLVVIAFFIFLEALERLFDPPEVYTERLLFVSVLGLFVNLFGMFVFTGGHGHSHGGTAGKHGHSHAGAEVDTAREKKHANYYDDHHGHAHRHQHGHGHSHGHDRSVANESSSLLVHFQRYFYKGVFLHVLADTLGSVAVILSTMLIHYFGWLIADPLCSLILSIIIGLSVIPLLRESFDALLLKTTPTAAEDLNNILKQLIQMDGVISCSRPRCWIVKSDNHVGTLHIQLTADSDQQYITQEAIRLLKSEGINSPIVQVEKDSFFRHMEALQPSYEPEEPISAYPRQRNLLPMAI
ncbi:Zinc transporter 5 [Trichinella britovi]|uniref:Zinc transporter 5 n=1 Tax=Trichinella britovi TaxID=45882 RepID=A0A0V1CN30_TRIBR|nr:Zinc transporter 5 [Trichinella britovi]